jgi:predicted DNA-binding protein
MTTRLQVTFEAEEHRRAKRRAAELGISLSEFVRRAVDQALDEPERPKADISEIFGIGNSGGSNVAKHKDEYVAEAIHAHLEQRRR